MGVFISDARPLPTPRFSRQPATHIAFGPLGLLLAVTLCVFIAMPPAAAQQRGPTSVAEIAAPLKESVVNISTTQTLRGTQDVPRPEIPEGSPFQEFFQDFFDRGQRGGSRRANSLGSGFVIDSSGLIVTNNHVIEGADEITAVFTDGSKLKVTEVVGRDPKTDLALLRVEPESPLPAVKFGDSDKMRVGDWVMAIGNPFGLGGTVTVGVISATRRDIQSGLYDEFLQTDASINRGNSGGPLFNMDGEVIGVNTAIISPTGGSIGIGFAVPSKSAEQVLAQLKRFGETRRGWLGVRIQTVTDEIAESVGLTRTRGALVASVVDDGPAAKAGVEVGDIILSFDGEEVSSMRELPKIVAQSEIDKQAEIVILRKGERQTLTIEVGRLDEGGKQAEETGKTDDRGEADTPEQPKKASLGLDYSDISDEARARFKIDSSVEGVVITGIDPNGPAADKDIKRGDVIIEVTQKKVTSPAEFEARLDALRKLNRQHALLTVDHGGGNLSFVAVPIADK